MSTKTALVTGATGLLGRQVVKAFERAGWSVTGTGYSRADGVAILKVDLAKPTEVEAALDKVKFVAPHYPMHRPPTSKSAKLTASLPPDQTLWFIVRNTRAEICSYQSTALG